MNMYAYVGGDPINHRDSTGMACGNGDPPSDPPGPDDIVVTAPCPPPPIPPNPPQNLSLIVTIGGGVNVGGPPPPPYQGQPNQRYVFRPRTSYPSDELSSVCMMKVAKKDGAGAALDAASIIPGGAELADGARVAATTASLGVSIAQNNAPGMVTGSVGVAVPAGNAIFKDFAEGIPGLGTFVGVVAFGVDALGAIQDYKDCMAGKS